MSTTAAWRACIAASFVPAMAAVVCAPSARIANGGPSDAGAPACATNSASLVLLRPERTRRHRAALMQRARKPTPPRGFFRRALTTSKVRPTDVITDAASVCPRVLDELVPAD